MVLPPRQKSHCGEGSASQKQAIWNYAIEKLLDVDRPFTVRVIVKGDDKIGGSLIDAEIAGKRTMLSYRPELTAKRLMFRTEGIEVKDVEITALSSSGCPDIALSREPATQVIG